MFSFSCLILQNLYSIEAFDTGEEVMESCNFHVKGSRYLGNHEATEISFGDNKNIEDSRRLQKGKD